jgi:hypothetical protein
LGSDAKYYNLALSEILESGGGFRVHEPGNRGFDLQLHRLLKITGWFFRLAGL